MTPFTALQLEADPEKWGSCAIYNAPKLEFIGLSIPEYVPMFLAAPAMMEVCEFLTAWHKRNPIMDSEDELANIVRRAEKALRTPAPPTGKDVK